MRIQAIYLILLTFTSCVVQNYNQKVYDYNDIEIIVRANIGDTAYCEIRKLEEGIFYSFRNQNSSNSYTKFISTSNLNRKKIIKLNSYIWSRKNKILKKKYLIKPSSNNNNQGVIIIATKYHTSKIHIYKTSVKAQEELIRNILTTLPDYPSELEYIFLPSTN